MSAVVLLCIYRFIHIDLSFVSMYKNICYLSVIYMSVNTYFQFILI